MTEERYPVRTVTDRAIAFLEDRYRLERETAKEIAEDAYQTYRMRLEGRMRKN